MECNMPWKHLTRSLYMHLLSAVNEIFHATPHINQFDSDFLLFKTRTRVLSQHPDQNKQVLLKLCNFPQALVKIAFKKSFTQFKKQSVL